MAFGPKPWHLTWTVTALTQAFEKLCMTHADLAFACKPSKNFTLLPPQEYIRSLGFDRRQQCTAAQRATTTFLFRLPFTPPLTLPLLYICAFIPLNYIVFAPRFTPCFMTPLPYSFASRHHSHAAFATLARGQGEGGEDPYQVT